MATPSNPPETTPSQPTPSPAAPSPPVAPVAVVSGRAQIVALAAVALGASFFFPWIQLFIFGAPSGFDFAKQGGELTFLWLWPVLCTLTLYTAVTQNSYRIAGQLAGTMPFAVFGYAYVKLGDLSFADNIVGGGWAAMAIGAVLLMLARR